MAGEKIIHMLMKYEIFYVPFWHYKACMRSCICPYSLQAKTTSFILIKARLSSYSTQNFNTTKLKTDWNCSYTMHQHTVLVFMGKSRKKSLFFPSIMWTHWWFELPKENIFQLMPQETRNIIQIWNLRSHDLVMQQNI